MQKNIFTTVVFVLALIIAFSIWWFILGDPANFKDGVGRHQPINLLGTVFVGGYFVPILIMLSILVITFVFERIFSLGKAKGKGNMVTFIRDVQRNLDSGNIDEAIKACDRQKGSLANIVRTGLTRYKTISQEGKGWEAEKEMAEIQRSIEEATSLELPLLERNLVILSTVASTATMVGLLGTTVGMIRAFRALAHAGAPDAIQLSIGISEALVNTALGLFAAIAGIVSYNFFVNKVDTFTYMIDEAGYNIVQSLMTKTK